MEEIFITIDILYLAITFLNIVIIRRKLNHLFVIYVIYEILVNRINIVQIDECIFYTLFHMNLWKND